MEKYFRTQENQLVNIVEHTLEQLEKWPSLKIRIGTDSQNTGRITKYATVILYRYGNRGAHFIYSMEEIPKVFDKSQFVRLFNEGVRTLEAYSLLTEELSVSIEALEFDFASVKKTLSSNLVGSFKGYHNAVFKGKEEDEGMIACKAADHVIRHPKIYK